MFTMSRLVLSVLAAYAGTLASMLDGLTPGARELVALGAAARAATEQAPSLPRVTYGRLSPTARATIRDHGVTVAAYVRDRFPDGTWHGDRCGCPDDRCEDGFHHDPAEECECLPAVLAELLERT